MPPKPKPTKKDIAPKAKQLSRWKNRDTGLERTAAEHGVVRGRREKSRFSKMLVEREIAETQRSLNAINALPFRQQVGRAAQKGKLNMQLDAWKRRLIDANRVHQYWDDRYNEVGGDDYDPPVFDDDPPFPGWFQPPPPPPPPPAGGAGGGIAV